MNKPIINVSHISSELIRIAGGIDASKHPSISMVISDIKSVLASVKNASDEVIITTSSYDDNFTSSYDDTDQIILQCIVKYDGTLGGKPFELKYTINNSIGYDGTYSASPDDESYKIKFDGVQLDEVNGDDIDYDYIWSIINKITSSGSFSKASGPIEYKMELDAKDGASDWRSDVADQLEEARDPYGYRGLRRSDFY